MMICMRCTLLSFFGAGFSASGAMASSATMGTAVVLPAEGSNA
jgi:hypothetical protein